ncbi:hypothetical protein B1222_08800 [Paenibacillus larvae subsp. pulvifaciens]|nr:hypothetical protein B1222_08800 [Paenibacillus larvae subsp. pulvifaciens]
MKIWSACFWNMGLLYKPRWIMERQLCLCSRGRKLLVTGLEKVAFRFLLNFFIFSHIYFMYLRIDKRSINQGFLD